MAAHWKGAAECSLVPDDICLPRWGFVHTVLCLTCRAVAELAVQWLLSAQLVLYLTAMAGSVVAGVEAVVLLVHLVRRAELPVIEALLALLVDLVGIHFRVRGSCGGVGGSGSGGGDGFVGTVGCLRRGEGAGGDVW